MGMHGWIVSSIPESGPWAPRPARCALAPAIAAATVPVDIPAKGDALSAAPVSTTNTAPPPPEPRLFGLGWLGSWLTRCCYGSASRDSEDIGESRRLLGHDE